MFKCGLCGSSEFQLMLRQGFSGEIKLTTNEFDEVLVQIEGRKEFIADIMFMNQFAVCKACGGIKKWEYFFPKSNDPYEDAKEKGQNKDKKYSSA